MILTHTRTVTYNAIRFADPYKTCDDCGEWITGYLDSPKMPNWPCGHEAGYTDQCPSWAPVDGCLCQKDIGHVPHGSPPTVAESKDQT